MAKIIWTSEAERWLRDIFNYESFYSDPKYPKYPLRFLGSLPRSRVKNTFVILERKNKSVPIFWWSRFFGALSGLRLLKLWSTISL